MDNQGPAGEEPPKFGMGKFLFSIILTIILFLLVQSMARHLFFSGGSQDRHGSLAPHFV
jgi:hypothetical protein